MHVASSAKPATKFKKKETEGGLGREENPPVLDV